ncbi:uncharacterized protein LOC129601021 [Paramacrobiotus metropolitanus]|uniref:uncharacterized protein LOC129601021 n=1 Tax=Paramacrobiotus metropolitanus TaxID=2943436 RepID=UPI0024461DEC|nr:uncharacterized protein LOC129601021 [Paramacrobiotus metropolitanus]
MNSFTMASEASTPYPKIQYQLEQLIAHHSFNDIYLAHRTHYKIAVKKTLLDYNREKAQALAALVDAELQHILTFDHPNLVRHLAHYNSLQAKPVEVPEYIILMEYCSGGTLHAASQFHIPAPLIQKWTRQIVDGLVYLHAQNILHGHIKGSHVLLSSPDWNTCQMKIGHLDAAKCLQREVAAGKEADDGEGTCAFMAPDCILGGGNARKSDVWSLGCVVLEMISGSLRFVKEVDGKQIELKNDLAIMYFVCKGGSPEIPRELPNELRAFVAYCLKRDPVFRPLAAELLYTNFLTLANVPQWYDPRPRRN